MATTKLLVSDFASTVKNVPSNYIRPIYDRPNLSDVHTSSEASIPLIDLHQLSGPRRSHVIKQIGLACQHDGFFQVKNHGIPEEIISNIVNIAREFFKLPESERLKNYSDDPSKTTRLSTSFNVKTEKVANWRDFLRLHCYPLQDYIQEWPSNPPSFKEHVAEYCTSVRSLILRLLEAISESLGLQRDYIDKTMNKHGQHMALNYYPPCPEPELETERRILGLYLGTKNVAGCVYDPALKILVPLWPPLYKEKTDTFSIAEQLKEQINQFGICEVVVGRWPWSLKEEQSEYDLILGAAKVECFMDDLLNTGILKDVKHLYYDARIVLNESGIKRRIRELKIQGIKNFTGEETKLLEDLCDAYASQFMLMHYFELAGDGAFNGSNTRECNIPTDIPTSERNSIITVERNKAVLTYALCSAGYLGKVFPVV